MTDNAPMPPPAELQARFEIPIPYPGSENCRICGSTGYLSWTDPIGLAERIGPDTEEDELVPCGACQDVPGMESALPDPLP
ncbi:hypothetical protein [Glycomyces tenuis]|nr:hypothetical protein [Glycomyces tenuis]